MRNCQFYKEVLNIRLNERYSSAHVGVASMIAKISSTSANSKKMFAAKCNEPKELSYFSPNENVKYQGSISNKELPLNHIDMMNMITRGRAN